jgi:hypothetical protein
VTAHQDGVRQQVLADRHGISLSSVKRLVRASRYFARASTVRRYRAGSTAVDLRDSPGAEAALSGLGGLEGLVVLALIEPQPEIEQGIAAAVPDVLVLVAPEQREDSRQRVKYAAAISRTPRSTTAFNGSIANLGCAADTGTKSRTSRRSSRSSSGIAETGESSTRTSACAASIGTSTPESKSYTKGLGPGPRRNADRFTARVASSRLVLGRPAICRRGTARCACRSSPLRTARRSQGRRS